MESCPHSGHLIWRLAPRSVGPMEPVGIENASATKLRSRLTRARTTTTVSTTSRRASTTGFGGAVGAAAALLTRISLSPRLGVGPPILAAGRFQPQSGFACRRRSLANSRVGRTSGSFQSPDARNIGKLQVEPRNPPNEARPEHEHRFADEEFFRNAGVVPGSTVARDVAVVAEHEVFVRAERIGFVDSGAPRSADAFRVIDVPRQFEVARYGVEIRD